ncbi:MAG: hypothetical protein KIS67_22290 [Verrucomicrobiae bacterium]|nr:hypothetical protein [Verrucomicrobiae bacterium]
MKNTKARFCVGLRIHLALLAAIITSSLIIVTSCSKSSSSSSSSSSASSVDITGNWRQPTGIGEGYYTSWVFSQGGKFSSTITISGKAEKPDVGTYKIRPALPSADPIPGDIVECSSPNWKNPALFRIPPNSSTLLIKVNCDDDSFSGGRPECWVTKEGSSPVTLQPADAEHVFTGTVVSTEQKKSGFILQLDTKVHGKRLECAITADDMIQKLGDVKKLEGKKIEVRGQPEEFWRSVLVFLEDSDQLKLLE